VSSVFPRFKIEFYQWWHAERKVCQSMHGRRAETKYLMSHFKHFSISVFSSISIFVKSVRRFNGIRSCGVNSTKKKTVSTAACGGRISQIQTRESVLVRWLYCLLNYQTGKWLWPWRRKLWGTGPRPWLKSRIQGMCNK